MDAVTKTIKEDTLVDIKFSGISWKGNDGFYYSSYDKPEGSELSAKTDQHKLYYHKLGTPQENDLVIFGEIEAEKHRYVSGYLTEDDRYLVISASTSTSGNKLFIKDLTKKNSNLISVIDHFDSDTYVIDNVGSKLYLVTNLDAPNQKIVTVDAGNPTPENWQDFIAETEHVLSPSSGGGYFFTEYMVDAISKVLQYDMDGTFIREVKLPGVGNASGFGGKKKIQPVITLLPIIKPQQVSTNTTWNVELLSCTGVPLLILIQMTIKVLKCSTLQRWYKNSYDHHSQKGLEYNGKNPTILYGYGGFNISLNPRFSVLRAVWMEQGGIYAVPNLRGGGEYGKEWHKAGTQLQKQNVFDDFIAAAEYLIGNEYTSSDYLAISGGSNGGLLVGATMTQRPDLMRVALPAVGVLDMLRYHTFTAGAGWAYDYGNAEQSKEMFEYLKGYSPVHNVKAGVEYPATLVTTGDHDDRVVPAHSFKFAAELQDKQAGTNPALIRIDVKAGHGAGKSLDQVINEYSDIYGFTFYNMGYDQLPNPPKAEVKE